MKPLFTLEDLRRYNSIRSREWEGAVPVLDNLEFCAMELGGESGEVLNAVKKLMRHLRRMKGGVGLQESREAIAQELADTIICCDRVATCLDIDLNPAIIRKFNMTSEKNLLATKIPEDQYL